jgi:hypothetical protein
VGGTESLQAGGFRVGSGFALLEGDGGAAGHAQVDVQSVFGCFRLGYALEVEARALAFGVDNSARRVPLGLGDPVGLKRGLPGVEARRWVLELVAESGRPEVGQAVWIRAIDDDLYACSHGLIIACTPRTGLTADGPGVRCGSFGVAAPVAGGTTGRPGASVDLAQVAGNRT